MWSNDVGKNEMSIFWSEEYLFTTTMLNHANKSMERFKGPISVFTQRGVGDVRNLFLKKAAFWGN